MGAKKGLRGLLAPFLGTLIPTRLFVEWSVLDPVVHTFAAELSHHLGDHSDEFALTVHNACQQVVDFKESGKAESAERMARKACNALQKTPNRHLKCCSFISVVDFDFRPIHSNCKKIEDYLNQPEGPWHKAALEQAVALCKDTVMPNLKGTIELGFENALQVAASAGPVAQRMKQSVSMGMGFATCFVASTPSCALASLSCRQIGRSFALPAALALAPALLRGALKVKVTAPQSTIPGMFVVVLPLLYCPMTWGMYHIAFQLVGDLWMLLGLLVLAFAPMVYLALGTYYSITRPLTDKAIAKVMVSINRASTILAIIGYVFICTFAWKRYQLTMGDSSEPADQNSVERDAYKYIVQQVAVLQPSFWLQLAGVALAKYFFTTLAGVDWMMVEIGKQRHYENLLEIAQKIRDLEASGAAVRYPPGLRTEEEREENLMAAEERGMRLDCVFYILFDEVPMHVMEEEAPITVTGRGRRTTVLQPAVSGLLEVEMENLQEEDNEVQKVAPAAALPGPPPAAPVVSSSPYMSPNEHEESGLTSAFNFFFGLRVRLDTPGARPLRSVSTAAPSAAAPWQMPPATAGPPFEAGRLPPAHWQTAPPSPRGQLWPAPPPPAWGRGSANGAHQWAAAQVDGFDL
ncbi:unnamed protein product [Effrenium voratum]|nr:unnamed protein product [Effrenium voratum]